MAETGVKPYYERDGITIYHGDCIEVAAWDSAEVMVTDPPYGMDYISGWSGASIRHDSDPLFRDAALKAWGDRPAIVFGRWSIPRPGKTRAVLVWDKGDWPGMGDLRFPWGTSHEEIYGLGEGFVGKRSGTVLRYDERPNEHSPHPTVKPIGLMRRLIEKCPSGVVIDPFMGSGTTIRAAADLSRRAIGIEIEERYCEIAAKRLGQRVLGLDR